MKKNTGASPLQLLLVPEMHALDLPILYQHPDFQVLKTALDAIPSASAENFDMADPLDKGTRQWLSRISVSELDWLQEPEELKEELREQAARRLAQECGVAASGSRVRTVTVPFVGEVKLNEPGMTGDNLGVLTWGASLVLARIIAQQNSQDSKDFKDSKDLKTGSRFAHCRAIELGAGTVLCGIVMAKYGVSVVLTDLPEVVDNLKMNIDLNHVSETASAAVLDWSNPEIEGKFDLAIISDPLYSKEHPAMLLNTLRVLEVPHILLELPLRPLFVSERNELYAGFDSLKYTRTKYVEEEGKDLFGNDQTFAYMEYSKN